MRHLLSILLLASGAFGSEPKVVWEVSLASQGWELRGDVAYGAGGLRTKSVLED